MIKRWLIRALLVFPLLCVVAVWVASYFGAIGANVYIVGRFGSVGAIHGTCRCFEISTNRPNFQYFWFEPATTIKDMNFVPTLFGFGARRTAEGDSASFEVAFPLWFATILLLALNWFVWRKTMPKKIGGAFPIEPTAKPGDPKP